MTLSISLPHHVPQRLGVQHLSDEAVTACADDVLRGAPQARAARHLAECAECARAVSDQRLARAALRTADLPALPSGLLERLRTLPDNTPLSGSIVAGALGAGAGALDGVGVDADGRAVFAAYGTPVAAPGPEVPAARDVQRSADPEPARGHRRVGLVVPVGVGAAAAAVVVGVLAGTAAGAGGAPGTGRVVTPQPARSAAPAMFITRP